jgi:hypothetical protein
VGRRGRKSRKRGAHAMLNIFPKLALEDMETYSFISKGFSFAFDTLYKCIQIFSISTIFHIQDKMKLKFSFGQSS